MKEGIYWVLRLAGTNHDKKLFASEKALLDYCIENNLQDYTMDQITI